MYHSRTQRWITLLGLAVFFLAAGGWMNAAAQDGPDDAQLQEGTRLYMENCAVCHGPNGEGRVGATLAQDWPSIRPDLQVENTIRNGIAGTPMPAWSQENGGPLTDEQIDAIVQFILSWETGGVPELSTLPSPTARPPIEPVPNVEGDPNHGAVLYDENCAVCHGPDGRGRVGAVLARDWPSIRPDLQVKTTIVNGVPDTPMPAWSQENGGPLTEAEINDLVSFIITLPKMETENAQPTATTPPGPGARILTGVGGIILFGVLFIVLVGGILLAQWRMSKVD